MSVWWLLGGAMPILSALAVVRAQMRLTVEVEHLEDAWRATSALGQRATAVRRAIEDVSDDASQRRARLGPGDAADARKKSANRLHADH